MKITPVKGTSDYSVKETKLRSFLQEEICRIYERQGFCKITTPMLEELENLEKSEGGENLNLIFKILKRGEKLSRALSEKDFSSLADYGLRYDLTLPLSRFFSAHKSEFFMPFKVIQFGSVFRAERPQKGRKREFVQCDIDIIGEDGINAEIELIDTTAQALLSVNFSDFTVVINDKRILKSVLLSLGFLEEQLDSVCITLDKLDKIGIEKIKQELFEKDSLEESVTKICQVLKNLPKSVGDLRKLCGCQREIDEMESIISGVEKLAENKYKIKYDFSLVRGQSYYTGPVFEIRSEKNAVSIGGGGRYDNLIGKFTNEKTSAVGFSIGFERLFDLLNDENLEPKSPQNRVAIIYQKEDFVQAMLRAKKFKKERDVALFEMPKKLGKLLFRLQKEGFFGYVILDEKESGKEEIKTF